MPHGRFILFQINIVAAGNLNFLAQILKMLDVFLDLFGFLVGITRFFHFIGDVGISADKRKSEFV